MDDLEKRLNLIRNDRDHGSRWLVNETISLLADLATSSSMLVEERMQTLRQVARQLTEARPAMAALAGAVARIMQNAESPQDVARQAARVRETYEQSPARIAEHARELVSGTIMTNSLSGTVLDVLKVCASQLEQVYVLEGRPRYEGRETARQLAALGIPTTLLTDAEAGIFLPDCQSILVGADSVLARGDVLNKAGTSLLAWTARGLGLPFYVACETLKITPKVWQNDLSWLEEKEVSEVLEQPLPGVAVHNFYFDRTPAMLVTQVITEVGPLDAAGIRQITTNFKIDW